MFIPVTQKVPGSLRENSSGGSTLQDSLADSPVFMFYLLALSSSGHAFMLLWPEIRGGWGCHSLTRAKGTVDTPNIRPWNCNICQRRIKNSEGVASWGQAALDLQPGGQWCVLSGAHSEGVYTVAQIMFGTLLNGKNLL